MKTKFLAVSFFFLTCNWLLSEQFYCSSCDVSSENLTRPLLSSLMRDFWQRFYSEPVNLYRNNTVLLIKALTEKEGLRKTSAIDWLNIIKGYFCAPHVYFPTIQMGLYGGHSIAPILVRDRMFSRAYPINDERIAYLARRMGLNPDNIRLIDRDCWSCNAYQLNGLAVIGIDKNENSTICEEEKTFVIGHELAHIKNKYKIFGLHMLMPFAIHAGCSLTGALLETTLRIIEGNVGSLAKPWLAKIRTKTHSLTSSLLLRIALRFVFNPDAYGEIWADKKSVATFTCLQGALARRFRDMLWDKTDEHVLWTNRLTCLKKYWRVKNSWQENAHVVYNLARFKINRLRTFLFDPHPLPEKRAYYLTNKQQFSNFKITLDSRWSEIKSVIDSPAGWSTIRDMINAPMSFR